MLRVGDDVRFEGCEYRIADIKFGLVSLEGVTGWFDPSMMKPAETREELKSDAAVLRKLLPSGYRISMSSGSVRIDSNDAPALFELLIAIRDGGAE
jgi:hypothetical protein